MVDQEIFKQVVIGFTQYPHFRMTWDDILTEFQLSSKEAFWKLCEDERNLNDVVGRLCEIMNMKRAHFRSMYIFVRSNPDHYPNTEPCKENAGNMVERLKMMGKANSSRKHR